jgi:hypothetical protein
MTNNCINNKEYPTRRFFIFILLLSLILGCKPSQQLADSIQTYQQRMASVLERNEPRFSEVTLPPYPSLSVLKHELLETIINLSEFYALKHCQLATIIAERNTVLGKIQLPSTRFIYEKKLINGLKICISNTEDLQLKTKLNSWLAIKNQSLQSVWADMLQTSNEIKQGMSSNNGFIIGDEQDGLSETLIALSYLMQSLDTDLIDVNTLESHLKTFSQMSLLANLWRSQLILKKNINTTTQWLEQQEVGKMCEKTGLTVQKKIEYLHNVFQLFFILKFQPIASQVNYYHYQFSPTLTILLNHPNLSDAFKHYINKQHFDEFAEYQSAMKQHIELWQRLFKQCNLVPGKPS